MRRLSLLLFLTIFFASAITSFAQGAFTTLQPGASVEKNLGPSQTHSYTVNLEKEQFLQLAIQPGGLDIVVRMFLPDGKLLREINDLNETEDVAYVELVSEFSGAYRFEITSVNANASSAAIHYQIKIAELRKPTDEELRAQKNESTRKAKGLALLTETAQQLDQFRQPENRVRMQIDAAQLLWPSDEKQARRLMVEAMETVKEVIAAGDDPDVEPDDEQLGGKLREEVIRALAPRDPEAALKFLQSTRRQVDTSPQNGEADSELDLESTLINQVIAADPKRAFELAEDMLNRSLSSQLIGTLNNLAQKDSELATRLASDIAKKVKNEDLIKTRDAAYLSASLLQFAGMAQKMANANGDATDQRRFLSEEEFRELFLKVVADLLAFSPPEPSIYAPELDNSRILASTLRQLDADVKTYAADRANLIEKRVAELVGVSPQLPPEWAKFQNAANNEPVDVALDSISQAPPPMRDYFYQQVVSRVASSGDLPRAQQIIVEHLTTPSQRQQALYSLKQQAVTMAAEKGRIDEALRLLSKFRTVNERMGLLSQVLDHIGPETRRSLAVQYIEQAKSLITTSERAQNVQQMGTLLEIATKLGPRDVSRAFQIVDPLIGQFNEISAAAETMNGFGHDYYVNGELATSNNNPVAAVANQLADTLATLAMFDFDRAKIAADGIQRTDVRLSVFLAISQRTLEIKLDTEDSAGYGYNQD